MSEVAPLPSSPMTLTAMTLARFATPTVAPAIVPLVIVCQTECLLFYRDCETYAQWVPWPLPSASCRETG